MTRITKALFLAPLLASLVFGPFLLLAYPVMLIVTLMGAFPLFLLLRKLRRLNWWHAAISGGFLGLLYAIFDVYNIDALLVEQSITYVCLGTLSGFVFWWLGIFRNNEFDYVSRSFPYSSLLLIPLLAGAVYLQQNIDVGRTQGRVISISDERPHLLMPRHCTVSVALTGGATVTADFWGCDWADKAVLDRCFFVDKRWSALRFKRVYDLSSRFGGGVDDC